MALFGKKKKAKKEAARQAELYANNDESVYENYVMSNADLMADYNQNWAGQGMSAAEYGNMHYYGSGQSEGRSLTGAPAPKASSRGGGGGGGGGGGAAAGPDPMVAEMERQEAARVAAEAARVAEMDKNNASINQMFDARAPSYDQYADDLYSHNMESYDTNADKARDQTKFAMARTGNVGGSVDADTSGNLEQMYQEGLLNLKSGSRDAANSLKAKDDQQRNSMLQQSASGTYNPRLRSSQPAAMDTSMTTMNAGVGNQFQSLLGGIGGAGNKWQGGY